MANNKDDIDDVKMTFGEHLEELRTRLIRGILGTLVVFIVVVSYSDEVVRFVVTPYKEAARALRGEETLVNIGVSQGFFAYMKVAIIVSLLFGAPVWMYQFWSFVSVGLYQAERRWVYRFAPLMVGLFAAGVTFGYLVLIPLGLRYLLAFGDPGVVRNWIGFSEYLAFFTLLTLVLGLTFELPIVMALLSRIGMVRVETFRTKRRYFILVAFIVAAILTPPDAVTQTLLALPMLLLYEFGIFLAWLLQSREERFVNWPYWRKRIIAALIVLGALAALFPKLHEEIDARLLRSEVNSHSREGGQGWTFEEVFRQTRFLDFSWDTSLHIGEVDGADLWVVSGAERAEILRVVTIKDAVTRMNDALDESRFLVRGAGHQIQVVRVKEIAGRVFIPRLLEVLAVAEEGDLERLDRLLRELVGADAPDGPKTDHAAWAEWWSRSTEWIYRKDG